MERTRIRIRLGGRVVAFEIPRYFAENWGAPFILGFMVLLMASAGFLAAGAEALANDVAVYAFYLLVAGVVLQLASYLRYGGEEEGG